MNREEFLEAARMNALRIEDDGERMLVARDGVDGASFAVHHADGRIMDVGVSPPAPTDFDEAAASLSIG